MSIDKIDAINASINSLLAPAQALSSLAVANMEKLAGFHLASLERYTTLGFEQLKEVASVRDAEGLQALAAKQTELLKRLGEKAVADAQQLVVLGQEFNASVQKVVRDSSAALTNANAKVD